MANLFGTFLEELGTLQGAAYWTISDIVKNWQTGTAYVTGTPQANIQCTNNLLMVYYNSSDSGTINITDRIKLSYSANGGPAFISVDDVIVGSITSGMSWHTSRYVDNHINIIAFDIKDNLAQCTIFYPANWSDWETRTGYHSMSYSQILYDALMDSPIVTYNWQSVPSISGKNGILSLSHVKDDSILTGDDINNIPLDDAVESIPARFPVMEQNLPNGVSTPVFYAGMVDYFAITKGSLSSVYEIIVQGRTVYSFTGSLTGSLGFIIDDENEVAKLTTLNGVREAGILTSYTLTVWDADADEMHSIWLFIHGHRDAADDPENNDTDEGTDPNYQPDIAVTGITKPGYGALNTGFTKMYRMSDTQLRNLAAFLWSDNFVNNVKKFFNDPREIIVGLSIMPVIPETGSSQEVAAGGISTGVYGLPLTDQYKLETYGYINIKAEKGNFLDYPPYTKVTAHLPFVGAHSLDVNDVMGKSLELKYIFDFLTGSCVAEIDVNGKPRYFFGGSCGIQIPTSSEDFSRQYSSILSAGATLGGTLATIATGGLAAPLAIGAGASMLANGMNSTPTVEYSSGSGSINGMIGCKSAFITIEKPIEKIAYQQSRFIGRPSFIKRQLAECRGYTKCLSVHLDTFSGLAAERSEAEKILLSGFRIETGNEKPVYTPTSGTNHGLILMKCKSDTDVLGKAWEDAVTIEGKLMYEQDIMKPVFVVDGNYTAYNYAYIPDFDRYYFITEQIIKTGTVTELHLQEDILQSWAEDILSNDAVLERQETDINVYFADDMYWTQANKDVKTVPFTTSSGDELVFEIPSDNYILTIAGGA